MPPIEFNMNKMTREYQRNYNRRKVILSFKQFLDLVSKDTKKHLRDAASYIVDTFDYYQSNTPEYVDLTHIKRFNLFDMKTERNGPIIGGEQVQNEIYHYLNKFKKNGYADKLILLHGPNGSAKTTTIEKIFHAMEQYSQLNEGAIYKFNWIFPSDKELSPNTTNTTTTIGFDKSQDSPYSKSFAFLEENKILSKIDSEYRENPLFLIPKEYRNEILRGWISKEDEIPSHILANGLSKKNQQIFECLLNAYKGDLDKVYQHVQVERFFFSSQYRVGISCIEPKMSADAAEKQLTMDKNYLTLPPVLQSIDFHQAFGEIVEANRGILEFSDLLKRPVEAFKYLLNTIESGTLSLPSGIAHLDLVYIATSNDKHLDAFKTIPDFNSFKGRFELIPSPYLLLPKEEEKIYEPDLNIIKKENFVAPHTINILCTWAVLTRLKQPEPEVYPHEYRSLIAKLDPRSKIRMYENSTLEPFFSKNDAQKLTKMRHIVWKESQDMTVYEGRFGASPRDIRSLLYRAAGEDKNRDLTPVSVFKMLNKQIKNSSLYEYLQIQPRGNYHNYQFFMKTLIQEYLDVFEIEIVDSMSIINDHEYSIFLKRYITHSIAFTKKDKIFDETTNSYITPSENIMESAEKILNINENKAAYRASLLGKIAAYKLENPHKDFLLMDVFQDLLLQMKKHFYKEKKKQIEENYLTMIEYFNDEPRNINTSRFHHTKMTIENLQNKYHYNLSSIETCLRFFLANKEQ